MKNIYKTLLFIILFIFCIQVFNLSKDKHILHHSFHSTLYLDYKFNEQEIQVIKNAALNWEEATQNRVKFKIVQLPTSETIDLRKGIMFNKVDAIDPEIIALDIMSGKPSVLGLYNNSTVVPYIKIVSTRLTMNNYSTVVEHELGHLIGLNHTDEPNTLMYPTIDLGSNTITENDLIMFCKKYKCN